jgi:L,D-transpeptidase YcbB
MRAQRQFSLSIHSIDMQVYSMRLSRRKVLSSMAMFGAAAALPASARAEGDSIWDMLNRNRVLRDVDQNGNSAAAQALIETIEPVLSYDTAYNLQLAIGQYEPFAAAGGWNLVSERVYGLEVGTSGRAVSELKQRLMSSGDLPPEEARGDMFDEHLDRALRGFQARHGLVLNGKVDEQTYYAMIVGADVRLNQLRLNLQRVNTLAASLSDRYVVVNIPAATIEAVEGGVVSQRHTAVVGRIDRPTPIMSSRIHQINFNPYWHVPKSIIRADLTRYMQENPNYLVEQRIHIYDGNGQEVQASQIDWTTDEAVNYMFRQEPGATNSMGHCKINFYNPYDCYLHDTPQRALFGENARFHSSGCVRVDQPNSLVAWLLRDNGGWDVPTVDALFETNERLDVSINAPVPLHTTYITAWANRQGTVSFRDDVYQFDAQGRTDFTA